MPVFFYTAKDVAGRQIKGKVEANSQREAVSLVRDRNLFLTNIREESPSALNISLSRFRRVSLKDIVNFTRQLSTMVTAGLQLPESLNLLRAQSDNPAFTEVIIKIQRDIQAGASLGTTLTKFPKQFGKTYIALVKAGESSGTLDKVLSQLADNLEKSQEFRSKVRGALTYPAIIFSAMIIVFFILMIFVVPNLTDLYQDFGSDLPFATRLLKGISDFCVRFWWLIAIGTVVGARFFSTWKQSPVGRLVWDRFRLDLPIIGPLIKKATLVDFTRTLGMLVGAGVSILDALNILVESMNNVHYEIALREITKKVEKGLSLGVLFSQYTLFPPILAQMVKVGEETGKMDESLIKLSKYFENETDSAVKGLTTAIEPLIMVVLGIGVGFIVFAIITPIYNLTSQFK